MRLLRSVTRRGYDVGTAGWFTITSPRRWFSASQLPTGFQDFLDRPKRTEARIVAPAPDQRLPDRADNREQSAPMQILVPCAPEHHLVRFLLIILVAAALTLAVLWWMIPGSPWSDYGR